MPGPCLIHTLDEARGKGGHCYLTYGTLVHDAADLVGQDVELLRSALHRLRDQRRVVIEHAPDDDNDVVVFPVWVHRAETTLADNLLRLLNAESQMPGRATSVALAGDTVLSEKQADAVHMALTRTVSVLTGGPGCGKSHTVGVIARPGRPAGGSVTLTAPTGRAARRLTELTGQRAMTVHRLVHDRKQQPDDGSLFDVRDALRADLIVVDEASMLDITIAADLVSAISAGSHLLFVGDVDQLPSVGPGQVLRDLLRVPTVPSVRLDTVYRQGPGSTIVDSANRIVRGGKPANGGEFWFMSVPADATAADIADLTVDLVTRRLPGHFDLRPADVQVLCPAKSRDTGCRRTGQRAQPGTDERAQGHQVISPPDTGESAPLLGHVRHLP